jgi:Domain of unknown function (DUF4153)
MSETTVMAFTAKLQNLIPDLTDTLRRFPVAVLAAVVLCTYANVWFDILWYAKNWSEIYSGCAAFLAGGASHLWAEGRGLSRLTNIALAFAAGIIAAGVIFFDGTFRASSLFLFGGLGLVLMVAPYLHFGAKQGALWLFNLRLGLAILLAILVGVVFGAGLSAVAAGLDFLFDIKMPYDINKLVWTLATMLVGPVYGLSLIPKDLTEEINIAAHKGTLVERGVSILVNYVMVPLAVIYALILHAYAIKIAVSGSLPKGEIGTIVSLFAVGGTATWLVGWPWRDKGTALMRLFMKAWFWFLPVPAILLIIAIWRRVSDYGVTPDRYGIAIIAVWTAAVFLYLLLRKNAADMRVILGSMAILLLIGSFGPQGAFGTTATSQFARLKTLLETNGVLKDGKVVSVLPRLDSETKGRGYSMIFTLSEVGALGELKVWFDPSVKFSELRYSLDRWTVATQMGDKLGVGEPWQALNSVNFNASALLDQTWPAGVRLIGPIQIWDNNSKSEFKTSDVQVTFDQANLRLVIGGKTSSVSVKSLMKQLESAQNANPTTAPMMPVALDAKTTLLVSRGYGQSGEDAKLGSLAFWIVQQQ